LSDWRSSSPGRGAFGTGLRPWSAFARNGLQNGNVTGKVFRRQRAGRPVAARTAMAKVSIVVAAFNEARHLERCLESLNAQEPRPHEVIVVDDGSTDGTAAVVEDLGVQLIRTPHQGPARARNVGAQAASGEILVFFDADMACDLGFISALVAPIRNGAAVGTFTKEIFLGNPDNRWARTYCRIRRLGNPRLLPESFPNSWANYRAILREQFLAIGGYEDVGYGEDMTLAPKVGRLAVSAPGARCLHFNPDSLWEIFENARWIGRGFDIGEVAHPWRDNAPWRALGTALAEVLEGIELAIVPARLAYCAGILIGLVGRRLRPRRHWK
jgi:glycosyltransferase involved in cell wall biosynthesis